MKWLIFSKDRPYQLDAFIRTITANGEIPESCISVLYCYSSEYDLDIETLKKEHAEVTFIEQRTFRTDVLEWLANSNSEIVSFATDDAIVTRQIPVGAIRKVLIDNPQVTTFSLRMGLHLDHCYPTNSKQAIPDGQVSNGIFAWRAANAEGDWDYLLSVDSHVFRRDFVTAMLESFSFSNPNTMESNWQMLKPHVSPIACCFPRSCYVNTPLNLVQDVYNNRCGKTDVKILNDEYRRGKRHNPEVFRDFINRSAHQELDVLGVST